MWERAKRAITEEGILSKDLVLGEALVSFVGRSQVVIENYRSILTCTDELIKIQVRTCRLELHGRRLHIDYYNQDQMKVSGQIMEMKFCD